MHTVQNINIALEQAYERSLCTGSSKDSFAANVKEVGQSWLYGRSKDKGMILTHRVEK